MRRPCASPAPDRRRGDASRPVAPRPRSRARSRATRSFPRTHTTAATTECFALPLSSTFARLVSSRTKSGPRATMWPSADTPVPAPVPATRMPRDRRPFRTSKKSTSSIATPPPPRAARIPTRSAMRSDSGSSCGTWPSLAVKGLTSNSRKIVLGQRLQRRLRVRGTRRAPDQAAPRPPARRRTTTS